MTDVNTLFDLNAVQDAALSNSANAMLPQSNEISAFVDFFLRLFGNAFNLFITKPVLLLALIVVYLIINHFFGGILGKAWSVIVALVVTALTIPLWAMFFGFLANVIGVSLW